jgi:cation diffusion facilitator CzcD-associated flavoprotein CzcO
MEEQSKMAQEAVDCTLCMLGADHGGIGALVAASQHLKKGDRVVILDRRTGWGGDWTEQHEFLRLHQPHQHSTAGPHSWKLKKPRDCLASRKEVLVHLEDIANNIGKKLNLCSAFLLTSMTASMRSQRTIEMMTLLAKHLAMC